MKRIAVVSILALALMSSCKKMALRHTCTCQLSRNVAGSEEELGNRIHEQIGTYKRAVDTCNARQDAYTYTTSKDGHTEIYSATCEVQ